MKHRGLIGIGLLAALAALGCDDRDTGGIVDAGPQTSTGDGAVDGAVDGATSDAGTIDASTEDAGSEDDAGR
jgi:hypothetical protein